MEQNDYTPKNFQQEGQGLIIKVNRLEGVRWFAAISQKQVGRDSHGGKTIAGRIVCPYTQLTVSELGNGQIMADLSELPVSDARRSLVQSGEGKLVLTLYTENGRVSDRKSKEFEITLDEESAQRLLGPPRQSVAAPTCAPPPPSQPIPEQRKVPAEPRPLPEPPKQEAPKAEPLLEARPTKRTGTWRSIAATRFCWAKRRLLRKLRDASLRARFKARAYHRLLRRRCCPQPGTALVIAGVQTTSPQAGAVRDALLRRHFLRKRRNARSRALVPVAPRPEIRIIVIPCRTLPQKEAPRRLLGAGCRSLARASRPSVDRWHVIPRFPEASFNWTPRKLLRQSNAANSQQPKIERIEHMQSETGPSDAPAPEAGPSEVPPQPAPVSGEPLPAANPTPATEAPTIDLPPKDVRVTSVAPENPEAPAAAQAPAVPAAEPEAPDTAEEYKVSPPNLTDRGAIWSCRPLPRFVRAEFSEPSAEGGAFEVKHHVPVEVKTNIGSLGFDKFPPLARGKLLRLAIEVMDERDQSRVLKRSRELEFHLPEGADKPVKGPPPAKEPAQEKVEISKPAIDQGQRQREGEDLEQRIRKLEKWIEEYRGVSSEEFQKAQKELETLKTEMQGIRTGQSEILASNQQILAAVNAPRNQPAPNPTVPPVITQPTAAANPAAPVTVIVQQPAPPTAEAAGGQPPTQTPPVAGNQAQQPSPQPESARNVALGIALCLFIMGLAIAAICWIMCHCIHSEPILGTKPACDDTHVSDATVKHLIEHEENNQLRADLEMERRTNSALADKVFALATTLATNSGIHQENNSGIIWNGGLSNISNSGTIVISIGSTNVTGVAPTPSVQIIREQTTTTTQATHTGFMPMMSLEAAPQVGIQAVYAAPLQTDFGYGYCVPTSGAIVVGGPSVGAPLPPLPPFDPLSQAVIHAIDGGHDHHDSSGNGHYHGGGYHNGPPMHRLGGGGSYSGGSHGGHH